MTSNDSNSELPMLMNIFNINLGTSPKGMVFLCLKI